MLLGASFYADNDEVLSSEYVLLLQIRCVLDSLNFLVANVETVGKAVEVVRVQI